MVIRNIIDVPHIGITVVNVYSFRVHPIFESQKSKSFNPERSDFSVLNISMDVNRILNIDFSIFINGNIGFLFRTPK